MSRTITIALIAILAASSIIAIAGAQAEIPTPSVPEFTVNIVDHSYDTPPTTPTYTTDPYTGEQKQVTTGSPSYHIENKSIEVTIKNQPFTTYTDSNGNYIGLYYNFRYKGHYASDWTYDPFKPDDVSSKSYGGWGMTRLIPYNASKSEYTIVPKTFGYFGTNYGEIDFQVQAQIGYIQEMGSAYSARVWGNFYNFTGQSSDWSSTQTINIETSESTTSPTTQPPQSTPMSTITASPTQNPTSTSNQQDAQTNLLSGFDWEKAAIVGLVVVVAVLAVGMVMMWRRIANTRS